MSHATDKSRFEICRNECGIFLHIRGIQGRTAPPLVNLCHVRMKMIPANMGNTRWPLWIVSRLKKHCWKRIMGREGWAVAVDGKHAISPHWIRKALIPNGKKKVYRGNPSVLRKVMFTHSYRPRQHCVSMWRRPKTTITLSPWTTAMLLFCKTRCPLVRLTRWSLSTIRFCSREITLLQRIAEGSQTRSTWYLKVNQKFCQMINLLEKNFFKTQTQTLRIKKIMQYV